MAQPTTATPPATWTASQTSDTVIPLPAAQTSTVITPEPGAYTQFNFKLDQIDQVATRADGALVMTLTNGSTLVIANFPDLVNSAESCGRDTLLQFMADGAAAGGVPFTRIVNITPDALAKALDPSLADQNWVNVIEPKPGMTREVVVTPGKTYKMDFDWAAPAKTVDGTNLLLSFKNGGLVILRDFVPVTQGDLPPNFQTADGQSIDLAKMVVAACAPAMMPIEALAAAPKAAAIEPAAGDAPRPMKKVVKTVEAAPMVAEIEPAAGGSDAPLSGGRGGGFSAGIDAAAFNGLNPLGPLAPTSLVYGVPRLDDTPVVFGPRPAAVPPVVPPPPVDDVPVIGDARNLVDETGLFDAPGDIKVVAGTYRFNYGSDGPGAIAASGVNSFSAAGSLLNGGLTAYGLPVQVELIGNTYRGFVNFSDGRGEVFELQINTDGTYQFTLKDILDHGNPNDPNDIISLNFGVRINDVDGDQDTGVITIDIVDDAPVARDDTAVVGVGGTVSGFVVDNDTQSNDGANAVVSVTVNGVTRLVPQFPLTDSISIEGVYGTFQINFAGTYTYTARPGVSGTDILTYTLRDGDGDTSTARLAVQVNDPDSGVPIIGDALCETDESFLNTTGINLTGTYDFNFGPDGAGAITLGTVTSSGSLLNGTLTSLGVPVVITQQGNGWVGRAGQETVFTMTVNTNGTYGFQLFRPLDHANGQNTNDVITLDFGIRINDVDGDQDTGVIRVNIADDAPTARDDQAGTNTNGVATGNVMGNDAVGQDRPGTVTQVTMGNVVYTVPATGTVDVPGAFGTLRIAADGTFTYTVQNGANGGDVFTYTLRDRDGDRSTATLTIGTADGVPVIGDARGSVDETNGSMGNTVTGTYTFNYGSDGPGAIVAAGVNSFSATGSLLNNQLTLLGVPVQVELVGNTYQGYIIWPDTLTRTEVFSLQVNTDGTYQFTLLSILDHADGNNPNDVISLNFGVRINDRDGDTDVGTITIDVLDDVPIARNDTAQLNTNNVATGNVMDNDTIGADIGLIEWVTVNGVTRAVPTTLPITSVTIEGTYGTFQINTIGDYTYTARPGANGTDTLTYTLVDGDGDRSIANLVVNNINDGVPVIGDDTRTVQEQILATNATAGVNGNLGASFGSDGPGSIQAVQNSFNASGSMRNNQLTVGGQAVVVTQAGNEWTGRAAGAVVFTLVVAGDGTYQFTMRDQFDHAVQGADIITLDFGVRITDRDGDSDTGSIRINVQDAAPRAVDDNYLVTAGNTVSGGILRNDSLGGEADRVTSIIYKGLTYTINLGSPNVIEADHGTLRMDADGMFSYTARPVTSSDVWLEPVATDVAAPNDPVIERGGLTVRSINPNNGQTGGDLVWVDNGDGWIQNTGIGVAGVGTDYIRGLNEGLALNFDQPQSAVSLIVSSFNTWIDGDRNETLKVRVYLEGRNDPVVVDFLDQDGGLPGFGTFNLSSAQFGGGRIVGVDIYSTDPNTDWTLCNVKFTQTSGGGQDQFQYVVTDSDGDTSSAFLNFGGRAVVGPPIDPIDSPPRDPTILQVDDPVTAAIADFVAGRGDRQPLPAVNDHQVRDLVIEPDIIQVANMPDLYNQAA